VIADKSGIGNVLQIYRAITVIYADDMEQRIAINPQGNPIDPDKYYVLEIDVGLCLATSGLKKGAYHCEDRQNLAHSLPNPCGPVTLAWESVSRGAMSENVRIAVARRY
jgi:hypothetical protein